MYNQFDFRFRYQVNENSPYATLFKYLSSRDKEFSLRHMVAWALSAFWYPLACKWLGQHSEDQLKAIARNAIYELQKQISYLARTFELEHELEAPSGIYAVSSTLRQPSQAVVTNGSNKESDASTELSEGLHRSNDDDLLDQMFN